MSRTSGTLTLAPARSQVEAKREREVSLIYMSRSWLLLECLLAGAPKSAAAPLPKPSRPAGWAWLAGRACASARSSSAPRRQLEGGRAVSGHWRRLASGKTAPI